MLSTPSSFKFSSILPNQQTNLVQFMRRQNSAHEYRPPLSNPGLSDQYYSTYFASYQNDTSCPPYPVETQGARAFHYKESVRTRTAPQTEPLQDLNDYRPCGNEANPEPLARPNDENLYERSRPIERSEVRRHSSSSDTSTLVAEGRCSTGIEYKPNISSPSTHPPTSSTSQATTPQLPSSKGQLSLSQSVIPPTGLSPDTKPQIPHVHQLMALKNAASHIGNLYPKLALDSYDAFACQLVPLVQQQRMVIKQPNGLLEYRSGPPHVVYGMSQDEYIERFKTTHPTMISVSLTLREVFLLEKHRLFDPMDIKHFLVMVGEEIVFKEPNGPYLRWAQRPFMAKTIKAVTGTHVPEQSSQVTATDTSMARKRKRIS